MAAPPASRLLLRLGSNKSLARQIRRYASESSASASSERRLYPSVEVLLHTNNLSASDIKATGPQGRILKGDVLAHLGKIDKEAPEKLSARYEKLSHLDLSNITLAAPAAESSSPPSKQSPALKDEESLDELEELSLSIDLQPLLRLQKRLQDTLGQTLELSELIARAVDLANRNLPAAARPPTTDELFDDILYGPTPTLRLEDGDFIPAINSMESMSHANAARPADIFDELVSAQPPRPRPTPVVMPTIESGAVNQFSVLTSVQERQRAAAFLERMKDVLEMEPGRLVL